MVILSYYDIIMLIWYYCVTMVLLFYYGIIVLLWLS